jgi:hypothetical protein
MKKVSLALLVSLFAIAAHAQQTDEQGVVTITDPAKADDVIQRAQALEASQSAAPEEHPAAPMKKHHKVMKHKSATKKGAEEGASAPAGASQ